MASVIVSFDFQLFPTIDDTARRRPFLPFVAVGVRRMYVGCQLHSRLLVDARLCDVVNYRIQYSLSKGRYKDLPELREIFYMIGFSQMF